MAHAKIAKALVREVPIQNLKKFLEGFGGPVALGSGCGNDCGSGCGGGCSSPKGLVFDQYGHTEISERELVDASRDMHQLKRDIIGEIERFVG